MMNELISMYEKGAITADHLAIESFHRVDPAAPGMVLQALPAEVLDRMMDYARCYRPAAMRTNYGLPPAADQVAAAKQWIEANQTCDMAGAKHTNSLDGQANMRTTKSQAP